MTDIKLIKQWGPYKPGKVIKDVSEVTIRELVGRLGVGEIVKTQTDIQVDKILEQEIAELEAVEKIDETDKKLKEEFDIQTPGEEIVEDKKEKKAPPKRRKKRIVKKRKT